MIIGVDVDDTLTSCHKQRLKAIKKFIKDNNLNCQIVDKNASNSLKICNWNEQECHKFWLEVGNDMFRDCKPQKSCAKVINFFKEQGHKIVLITARNDFWHVDAKKLTEDWLKKHNIGFDKIIYDCVKKKQVMQKEKINIMIDDNPSVCDEAKDIDVLPIIFSGPQNKDFFDKTVFRANNWQQILKFIKHYKKEQIQK